MILHKIELYFGIFLMLKKVLLHFLELINYEILWTLICQIQS